MNTEQSRAERYVSALNRWSSAEEWSRLKDTVNEYRLQTQRMRDIMDADYFSSDVERIDNRATRIKSAVDNECGEIAWMYEETREMYLDFWMELPLVWDYELTSGCLVPVVTASRIRQLANRIRQSIATTTT